MTVAVTSQTATNKIYKTPGQFISQWEKFLLVIWLNPW